MEKSIGFLCFLFLVKCRVICVEVFVIQSVLNDAHTVAEALEVDDLTLTQKADRVGNVAVIAKTQDIIVGEARFLLCRQVFGKIGNGVAGGLSVRGGKGLAAGGNGVDTRGVVHEIGGESAVLNLLGSKIAGELVYYRRNYLLVRQFLRADVRKNSHNLAVGHTVSLEKITGRSSHFPVGTAELCHYQLCKGGVGGFNIYGVL